MLANGVTPIPADIRTACSESNILRDEVPKGPSTYTLISSPISFLAEFNATFLFEVSASAPDSTLNLSSYFTLSISKLFGFISSLSK